MEMTVICVLCWDDAVDGVQLGGEVTFVNAILCAGGIWKDDLQYSEHCVITDVSFGDVFILGVIIFQLSDQKNVLKIFKNT